VENKPPGNPSGVSQADRVVSLGGVRPNKNTVSGAAQELALNLARHLLSAHLMPPAGQAWLFHRDFAGELCIRALSLDDIPAWWSR
jgi:hypothetical protein